MGQVREATNVISCPSTFLKWDAFMAEFYMSDSIYMYSSLV